MKPVSRHSGAFASAVVMLMLSGPAAAASSSVDFIVGLSSFTPGSGFGVDAAGVEKVPLGLPGGGTTNLTGGQGGSLLDVDFAASGAIRAFTLSGVGASASGQFGTVELRERYIDPAEASGALGVSATFSLLLPIVQDVKATAIGTATVGPVPSGVLGETSGTTDLTITWQPLLVGFGNGGQFRIDLNTLTFTGPTGNPLSAESLAQNATITLLAVPAVPEPEIYTMMLVGLGMLGFVARRRKQKAPESGPVAG